MGGVGGGAPAIVEEEEELEEVEQRLLRQAEVVSSLWQDWLDGTRALSPCVCCVGMRMKRPSILCVIVTRPLKFGFVWLIPSS
ncbi:hypothetical protein PIB30_013262 [Stylosanthes scabra]|uniref:Uncharacterized protein n=1 Tax=Stylosanthes scabra TaxID=79078 RepID=A0ABU6R698_9FABA|nr:hypothetical protein [Stylosanthes scabra]